MAIFDEKIEIRERCKGVHCVDLGESFPTSIYLQTSASIQPRTSPSKFGGKYSILFTGVLIDNPNTVPANRANVQLQRAQQHQLRMRTGQEINIGQAEREQRIESSIGLRQSCLY